MKRIFNIIFLLILALGFSSCKKDTNPALSVVADTFIKSVLSANNQPVYGLVHYISASQNMSSVSITDPNGLTTPLAKYDSQGSSFYLETAIADYTVSPPPAGEYKYSVKYADGTESIYTNSVSSSVLPAPVITSLAQSDDKQSVVLKWTAVPAAHGYYIHVTSGGSEVYTYPPFADNSGSSTLQAGIPISVFYSKMPGTFKIEIIALLYESTAYDLMQAEGSASQSIALSN